MYTILQEEKNIEGVVKTTYGIKCEEMAVNEVNTFWHTQLNISFIKGNNNRFESSVIIPFLIAQNRFYRRKRIWKL